MCTGDKLSYGFPLLIVNYYLGLKLCLFKLGCTSRVVHLLHSVAWESSFSIAAFIACCITFPWCFCNNSVLGFFFSLICSLMAISCIYSLVPCGREGSISTSSCDTLTAREVGLLEMMHGDDVCAQQINILTAIIYS